MLKAPNDRRSIRTKKMIRNALSVLIEEKGYNNISITDITTKADINRGTFYLHYTDKYDLLEKIENEVIQELQDSIDDASNIDAVSLDFVNNKASIDRPMPFMIRIFEYIKANSAFMRAILGPKGDPEFQTKVKELIETDLFERKLVKTFKKENMLVPQEYFISYVLSAHLGVIQQWLGSGMEKSPEDMALILSKMFLLGPFKAAGLKAPTDL
ncbi:MAG: TetR family transcriptional regulator [Clostridia bacterium BRH_c25]|nr:MAG: TetR family transcriptional regulator [Clostridia bacterium BRH_c25]